MKGSPMHRNYGIGSPAKQAKPDVEGEKKVMDKRTKKVEDHRKNAPKTTTTQEQADQLNQMDVDNVAAYNTSSDSIQNVHKLYRDDIEKKNAVIDSTNNANNAAYEKYMESTKKKKSPAKQSKREELMKEQDANLLSGKKPNPQRKATASSIGKQNEALRDRKITYPEVPKNQPDEFREVKWARVKSPAKQTKFPNSPKAKKRKMVKGLKEAFKAMDTKGPFVAPMDAPYDPKASKKGPNFKKPGLKTLTPREAAERKTGKK